MKMNIKFFRQITDFFLKQYDFYGDDDFSCIL